MITTLMLENEVNNCLTLDPKSNKNISLILKIFIYIDFSDGNT